MTDKKPNNPEADIIKRFEDNLTTCPVCGSPIGITDDERGTVMGFCSSDKCSFKAEVDYK